MKIAKLPVLKSLAFGGQGTKINDLRYRVAASMGEKTVSGAKERLKLN